MKTKIATTFSRFFDLIFYIGGYACLGYYSLRFWQAPADETAVWLILWMTLCWSNESGRRRDKRRRDKRFKEKEKENAND